MMGREELDPREHAALEMQLIQALRENKPEADTLLLRWRIAEEAIAEERGSDGRIQIALRQARVFERGKRFADALWMLQDALDIVDQEGKDGLATEIRNRISDLEQWLSR